MDIDDLLRDVDIVLFGIVAAITGRQWLRRRGKPELWATLALASVALSNAALALPETGAWAWTEKAGIALLVLFPYLILRFSGAFDEQRHRLSSRIAGAITAVIIVWHLLLPPLPEDFERWPSWLLPWVASVLATWTVLSLLAATRLWRAAQHQSTMVRQRLRTLAIATLGMTAGVLIVGLAPDVGGDALAALTTLSGLLFYLALAPPAWLRALWRRPEQLRLQQAAGSLVRASNVEQLGEELLPIAAPLVAAHAVALVDRNGEIIAIHDSTDQADTGWSSRKDTTDVARLRFAFGELVVRVSPYTPFFAQDELALLRAVGEMVNLALERIGHAERAQAATERLAAIVQGSDDAILSKSTDGIITSWNPAAERLYGYVAEDVIGKPISILIPDERQGEEKQILASVVAGVPLEHYATRRQRKDGQVIDVSLTVSPLRDADGDVIGASTIARDITERVRVEAAQQQARLLLESTSEGIFGIDTQGLCTFINDAAAQMLGYEPDELLGRHMHDTTHHTRPDGRCYPVEECPIHQAIRQGLPCRIEDEVLWRKDGSSFTASYSSSPISTAGETIGGVVTFVDITQRKQLQKQLERTAHDLAEANRELARADELKTQFLAMASHELRTPLTAIAGFTSTLLNLGDQIDDEQKREFLAIIDRQTHRLQRLVDDLLTLSRIESGALQAHPEQVEIPIAVKQVIRELGAEQVTITCVPEHVTASTDPDHLQQILTNYVGNAVKYGSPPIEITAKATNGAVEIRVSDHGRGVPEEFVPRLFERFQRARDHADAEGTGLGLSIVQGLAHAQGGDAWYEPNQPTGACFCVRLPRSATAVAHRDRPSQGAAHDSSG